MSKKDDFFLQRVPNFSLDGICGLCGLLHMSMDGLGIQVETPPHLQPLPRLGPMEVAILLQSGLAAVPQGRQVQQNQRMLLEMMVSQPPLFLKGVLYELSNNGSARVPCL